MTLATFGLRGLIWRGDANGDERGVGRRCRRAAGCAFFAQKLGLIAGRTAISRHQDFVVLALHCAARYAIRFDHPDTWAGRTGLALRPGGSGRSGRSRWTGRTHVSFGTLWTRWTLITLRTFAATGQ